MSVIPIEILKQKEKDIAEVKVQSTKEQSIIDVCINFVYVSGKQIGGFIMQPQCIPDSFIGSIRTLRSTDHSEKCENNELQGYTPDLKNSKSYELFKKELEIWEITTPVPEEKRGAVIAALLPNDCLLKKDLKDKFFETVDVQKLASNNGLELVKTGKASKNLGCV